MSASMNEGGGFVNVDVNAYLKNTFYNLYMVKVKITI